MNVNKMDIKFTLRKLNLTIETIPNSEHYLTGNYSYSQVKFDSSTHAFLYDCIDMET